MSVRCVDLNCKILEAFEKKNYFVTAIMSLGTFVSIILVIGYWLSV